MFACKSPGQGSVNSAVKEKPQLIKLEENGMYYRGVKKLESGGSIGLAELNKQMEGKTEMNVKLETQVESVCKVKGCWMTVAEEGTESIRVMFKDYAFFVPLDCEGREAVLEGRAYLDTTSVEWLRHYAEDAGASAEEIAKITEPEVAIAFEAESLRLK